MCQALGLMEAIKPGARHNGIDGIDGKMELAPSISLVGAVEHMTAAYLVVHGENDRQIPLGDVYRS